MFDKDEFKRRRLAAGHSQASFARALGVSTRTVARWERGSTAPPRRRQEEIQMLFEREGSDAQTSNAQTGITPEQDSLLAGTLLASMMLAEGMAAVRRINSLATQEDLRAVVREELRRHKVS